jgi:hypothetical protein
MSMNLRMISRWVVSSSIGAMFLCGFLCLQKADAQTTPQTSIQTPPTETQSPQTDTQSPPSDNQGAPDTRSSPNDVVDPEIQRCMESTCRSVPIRENLLNIGSNYIRGVFGGFEQGAGFGGGAQLTSKDIIPNLKLRANFLVSSWLDRRADLEAFVPSVGSNRNHFDTWVSYMKRNRNFFGIGSRIPRDFKTDFRTEQRSVQASFYRDMTTHLQGGVYSQLMNTYSFQGRNSSDPPIEAIFSGDVSTEVSQWAPGLFEHSKILTSGAYLLYDRRDFSQGLARGAQIFGRFSSSDGLKDHDAFSDYGWNEAELDIRGYIPIAGPKTSLALRSRGQVKLPKGGSQIPFYDLSWLGGREYVRGYQTYRFRANNVVIFSAELRRTVYAKTNFRGVDVFGFADTGQVWGDARSSLDPLVALNEGFSASNWHSGVGGGIQYRYSRHLAVRLEMGRSNEGRAVYLSLTRGF